LSAVLGAIAVVHGANKSRGATLSAVVAVLTVTAILSALALILSALRLMAEIPFATPLLPVARSLRLVGCFIHSRFTCEFWVFKPGNASLEPYSPEVWQAGPGQVWS